MPMSLQEISDRLEIQDLMVCCGRHAPGNTATLGTLKCGS